MSINIALVLLQLHGPIRQSLGGPNMLYDSSEFSPNRLLFLVVTALLKYFEFFLQFFIMPNIQFAPRAYIYCNAINNVLHHRQHI